MFSSEELQHLSVLVKTRETDKRRSIANLYSIRVFDSIVSLLDKRDIKASLEHLCMNFDSRDNLKVSIYRYDGTYELSYLQGIKSTRNNIFQYTDILYRLTDLFGLEHFRITIIPNIEVNNWYDLVLQYFPDPLSIEYQQIDISMPDLIK